MPIFKNMFKNIPQADTKRGRYISLSFEQCNGKPLLNLDGHLTLVNKR